MARGNLLSRLMLVLVIFLALGGAPAAVQANPYTFHDLGTLGGPHSYANGINAAGQVVGYSDLAGGSHAFLYPSSGGPMQDLGTLGGYSSVATGINASGQVVGYSLTVGTDGFHAFLYPYPGGPMQDLGTLGGEDGYATGVNASGQVVGYANIGSRETHAFLYPNNGGPMQDLGTLGGDYSAAKGINASGQVVGGSYPAGNGSQRAFLYPSPGGPMQDLGTLGGDSYANGINASGQVVGSSDGHAFLYTNGQMQDLNALVDLPAGVSLWDAYGINDQGWIVGVTSDQHAFLLTPIPGSLLLLGSGLLGLVGWRRFRKA